MRLLMWAMSVAMLGACSAAVESLPPKHQLLVPDGWSAADAGQYDWDSLEALRTTRYLPALSELNARGRNLSCVNNDGVRLIGTITSNAATALVQAVATRDDSSGFIWVRGTDQLAQVRTGGHCDGFLGGGGEIWAFARARSGWQLKYVLHWIS